MTSLPSHRSPGTGSGRLPLLPVLLCAGLVSMPVTQAGATPPKDGPDRFHIRYQSTETVSSSALRRLASDQAQSTKAERVRREDADTRMAAIYAAWPMIRHREPSPSTASPYGDRLFGNWAGLLPPLSRYGIALSASYLGMAVGNVAGGIRKGVDYAGQTSVALDVDWGVDFH